MLRSPSQAPPDDCYSCHRVPLVPLIALLAIVLYAMLHDIGNVPTGVFADEQLIGLSAKDAVEHRGYFEDFHLFFDHFDTVAGTLPVYATAPLVALFGLSEWSLRLSSVIWALGTGFVVWRILVRLRFPSAWLPPLVFLLSPLMIHISRINFGHTCSLLLIALGIYLYVLGRGSATGVLVCAIGGFILALAAYGYPGFYVAVPLYVLSILLGEALAGHQHRWSVAGIIAFALGAAYGYLPVIQEAKTNPAFMNRLEAKDQLDTEIVSLDWLTTALQSYPKYFRADYLFASGETGQEGARILRHSVEGAGLLSWFVLPLIALGLLTLYMTTNRTVRHTLATSLILLLLYPVPDLLTADVYDPPYTYATATSALAVPFMVAGGIYGLVRIQEGVQGWRVAQPRHGKLVRLVGPEAVALLLIGTSLVFVFSTYSRYPLHSSGYWGWQSGPGEIATYWKAHADSYDQLIMQGSFNEPATQLDFYIQDPALRSRAHIGGVEWRSSRYTQLFAVTPERYQEAWASADWMIAHVVYYPDESIGFYLMTRYPDSLDASGQPQLVP